MPNETKILVKRVGNGYLITKNFNEKLELIKDYDDTVDVSRDGTATTEVQQMLQVAACVIDFLGKPEYSSGLCHMVRGEPTTSSSKKPEFYESVSGLAWDREGGAAGPNRRELWRKNGETSNAQPACQAMQVKSDI